MAPERRQKPDLNEPVMDQAYDVTSISAENAAYERERARIAAERSYKVRPGMKGFNPDSADGRRQLRTERRKYKVEYPMPKKK